MPRERTQFGKPIYEIPAVTNMLIEMRVALESSRTLMYETARCVDLKERLETQAHRLKERGQSAAEVNAKLKEVQRIASLLTPLCKYVLTEGANKITYDALQIHGGTGYMREFRVERLARDARITNIYEGTSQLQIVAAIGGVITDVLGSFFDEKEHKEYKGALASLAGRLKEARQLFRESLQYVVERRDPTFQDVAAKNLVELYGSPSSGICCSTMLRSSNARSSSPTATSSTRPPTHARTPKRSRAACSPTSCTPTKS